MNFNPNQQARSAANENFPEQFDFDRWASQVRQQMIACLKRRGAL